MMTFEDYLQVFHAESYLGLNDDMSDNYDNWFADLDAQEVFDYAVEWGKLLTNKL